MRIIRLLANLCLLGSTFGLAFGAEAPATAKLLAGVSHFKQSTIRIASSKVVYFDPYRIDGEAHDADLILVTHSHSDHLSIGDIRKIVKANTMFVGPADVIEKIKAAGFERYQVVAPNQSFTVEGIPCKTVPAYNIDKPFHPKANNWVGYLATINQVSYYFAGDTDLIPEMKEIKADVAFLPVGGKYTMTAAEAAQAANLIKPKVAVPIHFLDVVGTMDDAKQFSAALDPAITGVILKQ